MKSDEEIFEVGEWVGWKELGAVSDDALGALVAVTILSKAWGSGPFVITDIVPVPAEDLDKVNHPQRLLLANKAGRALRLDLGSDTIITQVTGHLFRKAAIPILLVN